MIYYNSTRPNPIAHSIQKNPAQNKFRMGSDEDEGGHRTAEAESRRFGRDGADAGLWRNSSWSVRFRFTPPHAPRVHIIKFNHLDLARNTFELRPVDTAHLNVVKILRRGAMCLRTLRVGFEKRSDVARVRATAS